MEKYILDKDLKVFGFPVKTFPEGIQQAFDSLVQVVPVNDTRPYYGISYCNNNSVIYIAAAEETYEGEGHKYGYEVYTIEKGEYLAVTVLDWLSKTHLIKSVFEEILKNELADNNSPAIEVYKNMQELVCMVKTDLRKEILKEYDVAIQDLLQLLENLDKEEINTVPFSGSWTAAQLVDHVTKSNNYMLQSLQTAGKITGRKPGERVDELRKVFLDFSTKLQSPPFILPLEETYDKSTLIQRLQDSIEQLKQLGSMARIDEVVADPALGELTKFEILHFIVYHTQRHVQQLKNIIKRTGVNQY